MISLIITVYNEEASIPNLLKDILQGSCLPDEVVIVDAGSKDKTIEKIINYQNEYRENKVNLRLEIRPGVNIAQGRNIAISISENEIIAVTDAGCRLEKDWLYSITRPILEDKADMVGGFYKPVARSHFQKILADLTVSTTPPDGFLPSSRSIAFRKTLWEQVGGYPEWLKWGEDTLYDQLCLKTGARYTIKSDAVVYWEVRTNLIQALRQYYNYALGDGQALRYCRSHMIVQSIYWLSIGLALVGFVRRAFALIGFFHLGVLLKRRGFSTKDIAKSYFLLAAIQTVRFIGYVKGIFWRIIHGRSAA